MAFQIPLAIAGAGIFGALGGFGASAHNDAVEANALAAQRAGNEDIERLRISFFDQSRIASENLQRGLGNAENALYANFAAGRSINRVIAAEVMDGRKDQDARRTALDYQVQNIETQKRNIVSQANQSMQSVGAAILGGAAQGASFGASIGGGLDALSQANAQASFMSDLEARLSVEGPPDPNALAQLRAVNAGVPVGLIQQGGSIGDAVLQPFRMQIQTEALRYGALSNAALFAGQRATAAQTLFGISAQQYQSLSGSAFFNPSFAPSGNVLLGGY